MWRRCLKPTAPAVTTAQGIASPWPLTTWEDAYRLRAPLEHALFTRAMPPWPPGPADVDYHDARALSESELATFEAWLASDAPAWGEPPRVLSTPPAPTLPRTDAVLEAPEYSPQRTPDDQRCFRLPRPSTGDWVVGARIVPGNRAAAHHAKLVQADADADLDALEAEDPEPGWDCTDMVRAEGSRRIANWIPGYDAPLLPEGTGFRLFEEGDLVLVMHYWTPSWDGLPDTTRVELMLEDGTSVEPIEYVLLRDNGWKPGAGMALEDGQTTAEHVRFFEMGELRQRLDTVSARDGLTAYTAVPHMHGRGARTLLEAHRRDDTLTLLDITDWDVDWQLEYRFTEPVTIGPRDRLRFGCIYEGNGEAVAFGQSAEDEMCSMRLLVTARTGP